MPGLVDLQAEARWNKSCVPIGFLNEQDKSTLPNSDCMPQMTSSAILVTIWNLTDVFSDLLVHKTFSYLPLYPYHGKELCAKRSPLLYLSVVNGGWSNWSECSNGLQRRKCNKPTPASGGLPCVGDEQRACSTEAAQVLCKGHSCTSKWTVTVTLSLPRSR